MNLDRQVTLKIAIRLEDLILQVSVILHLKVEVIDLWDSLIEWLNLGFQLLHLLWIDAYLFKKVIIILSGLILNIFLHCFNDDCVLINLNRHLS